MTATLVVVLVAAFVFIAWLGNVVLKEASRGLD